MLAALSAAVALGCAIASARRLRWAATPAPLDADLLREALAGGDRSGLESLRAAIAAVPDLGWERDLLSAFAETDARLRAALVSEQLTELEGRAERFGRVPRVCASVSTSAGFLFASVWLLGAVAAPPLDSGADIMQSTFVPALDSLAIGVAGTFFCAAVHVRAGRISRRRMRATDRLVETLEDLATRPAQVTA